MLLLIGCGEGSGTDPELDRGVGGTGGEMADLGAGGSGGTQQPDAGVPYIELGTGDRRYQVLEDEQIIPVIQGIQGGYHVWGAIRGDGFPDQDVIVDLTLSIDDHIYAQAHYTEPLFPRGADGLYDYPAVAVIFDSNDDVAPTNGLPMLLRAEVTPRDGMTLFDERVVIPDCCVLPTGMRTDPP